MKPDYSSNGENEPESINLCYCKKPRDLSAIEVQCAVCLTWFHGNCITSYLGHCSPLMLNYQFCCKSCNPTGQEAFNKRQASFSQMCQTTIANLMLQNKPRLHFSRDDEIVPFIEKNWENLTSMPRRVKSNWHTSLTKTMLKEPEVFSCENPSLSDPSFGLICSDLLRLSPYYDRITIMEGRTSGRGVKRKTQQDSLGSLNHKSRKDAILSSSFAKLSTDGFPIEHPFNKDGYRYVLAELDPHAPGRQAFDEREETTGKPIPGFFYRKFLGSHVLLALHDRAPQLRVSDNRLSVTGEKGYSMIRATHGIRTGGWYFEITIDDMPQDSATRVGWSQPSGNLQAPCGYDKFSYSWRSRKGTAFHTSRGKHYSDVGYSTGDIIGCYIYLPPLPHPHLDIWKEKTLVNFKSHLYFEEKERLLEAERELIPTPTSKIVFYKNGRSQGTAFANIYSGEYFPCISLYKNVTVTVNFGPNFSCTPMDIRETWQPMCSAAEVEAIRESLSNIVYLSSNENKLDEILAGNSS